MENELYEKVRTSKIGSVLEHNGKAGVKAGILSSSAKRGCNHV